MRPRHCLRVIFGLATAAVVCGQQYTISTVAGGIGMAPLPHPTAALLSSVGTPVGIATDNLGKVYFATAEGSIYRLDTDATLLRVAGRSLRGFSGDGGRAIDARLDLFPKDGGIGLALNPSGTLYVTDTRNHRIRMIGFGGIITTVAGTGIGGYSGDGGPALKAELNFPAGLALDRFGNLYIADTGNNRVRRVSPMGIITTIAGTGTYGYSGDGRMAINAELRGPHGLALDSAGSLYIADSGNGRVRKVSQAAMITTIAGGGETQDDGAAIEAELGSPEGLTVDRSGNLYVSDFVNRRIRRVSPEGLIRTVAGSGRAGYSGDGGLAVRARLSSASEIAVDDHGNIYLTDSFGVDDNGLAINNHRIRRVSTDGIIVTVAGNGQPGDDIGNTTAASIELNYPTGLALGTNATIYIADSLNHRVVEVNAAGVSRMVAGNGKPGYSGDGQQATDAQMDTPAGVTVDRAGNLYIADFGNNRIRRVSPDGIMTTVVGNGSKPPVGNLGDGGLAINAELNGPCCVAFDPAGNLFIADTGHYRIRKVTQSGIITTVAGNGRVGYSGDTKSATLASLTTSAGIAIDGAGTLYIADIGNQRIRKVSNGIITILAGTGFPGYSGDGGSAVKADLYFVRGHAVGMAVDNNGALYIGDGNGHRVRRIFKGLINTIGGSGMPGYEGDSGPADKAQIGEPAGLAVDDAGSVFLADCANNVVRVLRLISARSR